MKTLSMLVVSLTLVSIVTGCSSKPPKVEIPATANPSDEIASLEEDLKQVNLNQADVLSPINYEKAELYLSKAKKLREKVRSNSDVLEDLAYGRSYLNMAKEVIAKAEAAYPEIVSSRKAALTSGAGSIRSKELRKADDDLKFEMKRFESKLARMDNKVRDNLNIKYLDIQLDCIKAAYLDPALHNLKIAKKEKAQRNTPRAYASAEAMVAAAERTIEVDRYNTSVIGRASADALAETQKLLSINRIVGDSKKMTREDVALGIYDKNKTIEAQGQDIEVISTDVDLKNRQLNAQKSSIRAVVTENSKLESKEKFNQSFEAAQRQFSKNEAEVYRDGSNLLIRLKAIDFKPGQSNLSAKSFGVLNKVKSVIQEMDAKQVVIEGHTDSIGTRAINERLSKDRASTVAKYFVSDDIISGDKITTEGLGFEKPIATNKTKEGRAQNRRVDIIITPTSPEAQ